MLPTHNKSVATGESLRFTLRDLAPPILRRKWTLSLTFLFVVAITLLAGNLRSQKYQAHSSIHPVRLSPSPVENYQAALTDAKAASNTIPATQASQSLDQADLDREAKLDEQNYLLYLSTQEQQRAKDTSANNPIPNVTITVSSSTLEPPPHISAVTVLIAIVFGLLISLSVAYIADYRDPCFRTPVQVIRALGVPLVVAIPKRTS